MASQGRHRGGYGKVTVSIRRNATVRRSSMLFRAVLVIAMGSYALLDPRGAEAASIFDDGCAHCISNVECGSVDPLGLCQAFGCSAASIGCAEVEPCRDIGALVWCSSDPF